MSMRVRLPRWALLVAALCTLSPARAGQKIYTGWLSDVAIKGYDPVAYFTRGEATKGTDAHSLSWEGATWHFASAEHRALFKASPERYAPQYGGHCAFAVAKGDLVKIDPEAWSIVNDKLYLNYSASIQRKWEAQQEQFIQQADARWPEIGQE